MSFGVRAVACNLLLLHESIYWENREFIPCFRVQAHEVVFREKTVLNQYSKLNSDFSLRLGMIHDALFEAILLRSKNAPSAHASRHWHV
jgi:hypothetical protein